MCKGGRSYAMSDKSAGQDDSWLIIFVIVILLFMGVAVLFSFYDAGRDSGRDSGRDEACKTARMVWVDDRCVRIGEP